MRAAAPASCSSGSAWPTPPTGSSRRSPAACAAGSTSPRRSSPPRRCCSSTSRRPAWTRRAATTCGRCCATSSATAPRCCSPPSTSRRPTGWPTTSWCSTTAASSRPAPRTTLKARIGGERIDVKVAALEELPAGEAALAPFADGPSSIDPDELIVTVPVADRHAAARGRPRARRRRRGGDRRPPPRGDARRRLPLPDHEGGGLMSTLAAPHPLAHVGQPRAGRPQPRARPPDPREAARRDAAADHVRAAVRVRLRQRHQRPRRRLHELPDRRHPRAVDRPSA